MDKKLNNLLEKIEQDAKDLGAYVIDDRTTRVAVKALSAYILTSTKGVRDLLKQVRSGEKSLILKRGVKELLK